MMNRYLHRRRMPAAWSPFREMEEMERMMEETFGRPFMRRRLPEEEYIWAPSIEMYEKENSYIIRLELPGVKPDNVDISISGDTLTVKGERVPPEDIKDEEYQLCEMCYGSFNRSIVLPEPVNADAIEANFENGIMDIRLPKKEEVKPRQIKIQSRSTQPQAQKQKSSGSQESIADAGQGVSESEQESKTKIPYEG
ncbi:MAG: Hsp20/alpha crystallin family protein [Dehalococcoidales bacterium]|nr:Hsp20/alpha crystallin family protein [Dehalococcoidales bacterium]